MLTIAGTTPVPATPAPTPVPTAESLSETLQEVAETTGLSGFMENVSNMTLERALFIAGLVLCGVFVVKFILHLVNGVLERGKIEKSLHSFIRNSTRILLWSLFAIIVASSLGVDVSSLVAILGVVGLAISLAIQGSLSNLAGGLQVLTAKPFKVGDYIETNSVSGTVQEIGMSHTRMLTVDNKEIFVPNSEMAAAKIVNYSSEERRRVDLKVTASYDDSTAAVVGAILRVIEAHPKAILDPAPFVRLSAYLDSSIEYTVRVWCKTEDYWDLYFDLMEQIRESFDRDGITMTYPHLNVHMGKE